MHRKYWLTLGCMDVSLILVVVSVLAAQTAQQDKQKPAPSSQSEVVKKARGFLEAAEIYLEIKNHEAAKERILKGLETAPDDPQIRERARNYLTEANNQANEAKAADTKKRGQKLQGKLGEAERLAAEGKNDKASQLALEVLGETEDKSLIENANRILAENRPSLFGMRSLTSQRFFSIGGWGLDIIFGVLFLCALSLVMRLCRCIWACIKKGKWAIEVNDTTGLGIGDVVIESLSRWSKTRTPVSAGLLRLETPVLPPSPQIEPQKTDANLSAALESVPLQIGTVTLAGVGKAMDAARRWINGTRSMVNVVANVLDAQIVIRLTARWTDGKRKSVIASVNKSDGITAATAAAEAASYKMYFLIAKESTIPEAEGANKLREGLGFLAQYISGRNPQQLDAAYDAFRSARSESPAFEEAYLYEGVTLDLMEQHDEAVKRFQYVAANTSDPTLRDKANYNVAVSHFRKYSPDELELALKELDSLVGPLPDYNKLDLPPIKALALAAKANGIAHKPLFWQELALKVPKSRDVNEILDRKARAQETVKGWLSEVTEITAGLEKLLEKAKADSKTWDEFARQQLKWAIRNARGNTYLNYAKSFLTEPHLEADKKQEARKLYLQKAYDAFQDCEMLLTPGVETLTNLATVVSELGRGEDARTYLQRTIKLNPAYEYAYYRLAQSWEKENKTDKLLEVLKSFAKDRTPKISGFQDLYRKYATELART